MSPLVICLLGLAAFFIIMSQGMPIAFAFAIVGCVGIMFLKGIGPGLAVVGNAPFTWATMGALLPVPLFMLMAHIMTRGGVGDDLFDFVHVWLKHLPGGLAMTTVITCAVFAAICAA